MAKQINFCFAKKVAAVCGATGHIGRHICTELVESQIDTLILIDKDPNLLAHVRAALIEHHNFLELRNTLRITFYQCDFTNSKEVKIVTESINQDYLVVDFLVHASGYVGTVKDDGWAVPLEQQSDEAWDHSFKINVQSAFLLTRGLSKSLARAAGGSVTYVSSIYGSRAPYPGLYTDTNMHTPVAYGASKAALEQVTRHLAAHYSQMFRVNSIALGGIFRDQNPKFIERYLKITPVGRMGTESDVSELALFLLSTSASWITGQIITLDGGSSIW